MAQEIVKLYNDTIELLYKETAKTHSYWVDGRRITGATTPLGVINKPGLLYWSANSAVDYVLDKWKPGVAYDELYINDTCQTARKAHVAKKDKAATKGSLVHDWIHEYIKYMIAIRQRHNDTIPEPPKAMTNKELQEKANSIIRWFKETNFSPHFTERKVLSLKHWIAGTLDTEGMMGQWPTIIDFKNSSGIYPEMKLQLSCYISCRYEESQITYPSSWIVRIGDEGEIETYEMPWKEVQAHFEAFLHAKALYEHLQAMNKEARDG